MNNTEKQRINAEFKHNFNKLLHSIRKLPQAKSRKVVELLTQYYQSMYSSYVVIGKLNEVLNEQSTDTSDNK